MTASDAPRGHGVREVQEALTTLGFTLVPPTCASIAMHPMYSESSYTWLPVALIAVEALLFTAWGVLKVKCS